MAGRIHFGQFTPNSNQPPDSSCLPHCLARAPHPLARLLVYPRLDQVSLPSSRLSSQSPPLMSKELGQIRCAISSVPVTSHSELIKINLYLIFEILILIIEILVAFDQYKVYRTPTLCDAVSSNPK